MSTVADHATDAAQPVPPVNPPLDHPFDPSELAEAITELTVAITIIPTAGLELDRCQYCPDTEDWPAFPAAAVIARTPAGETTTLYRSQVCPGCLNRAAQLALRYVGATAHIEVPK